MSLLSGKRNPAGNTPITEAACPSSFKWTEDKSLRTAERLLPVAIADKRGRRRIVTLLFRGEAAPNRRVDSHAP